MTKIPFRDRLKQGNPILGDGAMGTMLHHESHADTHACFEALNVDDPELVVSVHKAYIEAGSDIIESLAAVRWYSLTVAVGERILLD